ncbi:MAG: hypothetical protein M1826_001474 [Phylliscum demangeonii]|nr:MAG: hypothetical protein M1826_001474 [Phylliscum demangeonii]
MANPTHTTAATTDEDRANPSYLNHLATHKLLDDPAFIAYLRYLRYFARPEYATFLTYPGPTLNALELLQQVSFRKEILSPDTVMRLAEATAKASIDRFAAHSA